MARKQKHEKEPNLERWLVSYADFITLLFAVFVTLYAMSIADAVKVQEVKSSIQSAFGIVPGSPTVNIVSSPPETQPPQVMENLASTELVPESAAYKEREKEEFTKVENEIQEHLKKFGAQEEVKLTVNERGLVISLKEAGFFASGSAQVAAESQPLLDKIAVSIAKYTNAYRVEGHTDNVPITSPVFSSNWELSTARATSVVRFLISRHGFSGAKLSATGYGEYRPIGDNSTDEGRKKNRRVDIVLLSQKSTKSEPGSEHQE